MYGMFPLAIGELRTPRERGYASTVRSATGTTEIRGIGGGECPQTSQLSRSRWDYERPLCGHSLRSAATAYDAPLRHSFDAYFGALHRLPRVIVRAYYAPKTSAGTTRW